jgi:carbamoyl-phosphate synthase large subunit
MATTLYSLYEKLFDRIYKVPRVDAPHYRKIVESILEKEKPDAVIVVPEVEVLYWSEHPFDVPHIVPPADFCRLAISKKKVFEALGPYGLVPESYEVKKSDILKDDYESPLGYPVWIRDASAGTASGKGSFKAENLLELQAWANINTGIDEFQLSQYLPGGNYGVFMLFDKGVLRKVALAERIEYIMAKVAVSGITGNTCKGRLLNDETIKGTALKAMDIICKKTGSVISGLCVIDMKADAEGKPYVTEINIRHVAYSSMFAVAGFNIAEAQLLLILGRGDEIEGEVEKIFPKNNLMLRDVDGLPIFVEDYHPIEEGECM